MLTSMSIYLKEQIENHILLFFSKEAYNLFKQTRIYFLPINEAKYIREQAIVIPIDIPVSQTIIKPYKIKFNGTYLTLWNRIPIPDNWICLPNEKNPLWYQHKSGTLMPAYNMFANIMDLLTLNEERKSAKRDLHGRFPVEESFREKLGLLEYFNLNFHELLIFGGCLETLFGLEIFTLTVLQGLLIWK
jgi:hypothetical protein